MKKILFIFFTLFTSSVFAQKANLIKQLPSFVPTRFNIQDTAFGDLNNDSKMDVVLIVEENKPNAKGTDDPMRSVLLLLQQPTGKLKQVKRNDNMIMCKTCGGTMGDPFAGVFIKNNAFMLEFSGGSGSRWGYVYKFSWNASMQTWQLTKEEQTYFEAMDEEATAKTVNIPSSEIDHLNVDNFSINDLNELEEVKGRVIADKCYFYNAPNLATKRKAYVTKGDKVSIQRAYKTFYEVFFENEKGQFTEGFLLKKEVQRLR